MFNHKNPNADEIKQMIAEGKKPMMFYHISKDEILSQDLRGVDKMMKTVQSVGKGAKQSLVITVDGYDDVPDELYEIKEVREFVEKLFRKYPHLLYYISNFGGAEQWIVTSLADEVLSVTTGEKKMTGNEIWEKYGLDMDSIPQVQARLTFKGDKFIRLLKPIIKHGKNKKDATGAKKIAVEYALKFDNSEDTIRRLNL